MAKCVKGIVVEFEDGTFGVRKRGAFFVGYLPFKSLYKYRDFRYDKEDDNSAHWKSLEYMGGLDYHKRTAARVRDFMTPKRKPTFDSGVITRIKNLPIN